MIPPGPPERFGPFELLAPLGRGGMAEVWRARPAGGGPPGLPELVALKRLRPELADDARARAAFLTEADVAPLLRHPNLVRVHASGETGGRAWLAMELVEGADLEQLAGPRPGPPLKPGLACFLVREVARGLDHLHRARGAAGTPLGLVHRDVTPANVFVSRDGRVKLGDLGVALLAGLERQSLSGRVKGKLRYLSPEQVVADDLDARSDLFALGAVLFELLTGRFAFDQDTELAVMTAIRDGKCPRLRRVRPDLPRDLEAVVSRTLARRPARRVPSAAALIDALDAVVFSHGWELLPDEAASHLAERFST